MRRGRDGGMTVTWVALLRGINVGRNKRIAMADLRTMLVALGNSEVRTLGQSGNLVFSSAQRKVEPLEQEISKRIRATFGMDVAVLLRTADEFAAAVDANPFVASGVDATELHVAFLSRPLQSRPSLTTPRFSPMSSRSANVSCTFAFPMASWARRSRTGTRCSAYGRPSGTGTPRPSCAT
jgi:hypothetical protein